MSNEGIHPLTSVVSEHDSVPCLHHPGPPTPIMDWLEKYLP